MRRTPPLGSEIGSIGVAHAAAGQYFWRWAIDAVIPARKIETHGRGIDREDCMMKFKAAWERFAADPKRLDIFLATKRKRLRAATTTVGRPTRSAVQAKENPPSRAAQQGIKYPDALVLPTNSRAFRAS